MRPFGPQAAAKRPALAEECSPLACVVLASFLGRRWCRHQAADGDLWRGRLLGRARPHAVNSGRLLESIEFRCLSLVVSTFTRLSASLGDAGRGLEDSEVPV